MNEVQQNWLDRTIGFFSPRAAYERFNWRGAMLRNYDAADSGRRNSGWSAVNSPAEQTNQGFRDQLRSRARDLERNSDVGEAITGALERNVTGTGIQLQARIQKDDGVEDEELNKKIETLWKKWCRFRNCDITGQLSFSEMQEMAVRRMHIDGGILFVKVFQDGKFKLQVREVDDIDSSLYIYTAPGKSRIINGIELNEYNKPVAFWLKTTTPDGLMFGESKRIPADQVIYLFRQKRPTQIREVSELSRTAGRVRDINEFVEAISVKERILACLAVFIRKMSPSTMGKGLNIDAKSGYEKRTLAPGMINELQPGEDISTVNPGGQASNARDFITTQQRLAGAGQGLSYEIISRDMSQSNYSSARQGLLEDQRTFSKIQKYLIDHFCYEVYREFLITAVLSGQIYIPDFWQNFDKYMGHEWITPGWSWIDPLKEVKANEIALKTGQTTLAEICASKGSDWRDVLNQRAKEKELENELGLNDTGEKDNGTQKEQDDEIEKIITEDA